jgi:hypothetical protein
VQKLTIPVKGLKINTLVPPAALPADWIPPEPQPAGHPVVDLVLEGSQLTVRAILNGKSIRRALKVIAEHGAENVNVVLQGTVKPPERPNGPFVLEGAGLVATPRVARPEPPPAAGP